MADAAPSITYRQMANISQWRMYDDAMKKAQATIIISCFYPLIGETEVLHPVMVCVFRSVFLL